MLEGAIYGSHAMCAFLRINFLEQQTSDAQYFRTSVI